ncbi:hypothetical protein EVJ58_g8618 [Rhodofomes roseus]|uniref:Uncharacterized protein n=1 Tax=Rhodofomes roseus TaxID=34475 RepID=A0A4Y9XXH0_9APHY|nr:hypothetical protein EVJ58_g8618 [Rhodofomes roseus]
MLIFPLLWEGASALASVLLLVLGSHLSLNFGFSFHPPCFNMGLGAAPFQRTIEWKLCPSVLSGSPPLTKANRFHGMPYIPIPVMGPHLVLPLGLSLPNFNDQDDEVDAVPSIEFDLDSEGLVRAPVALPTFEPVEHVPITWIYRVRSAGIRWLRHDPGPSKFHNLVFLTGLAVIPIYPGCILHLVKVLRECRAARYAHRSPLYPLFNQLMGPDYGAEYWAENRDLAAPRRPDFPGRLTLWGRLVALTARRTAPD